jgi:hypothetical protein
MATRIQLRRDIDDDWYYDNPILASGEIAISLDLNTFKIGDGQTQWRDLDYALSGTLGDYIPLTQKATAGGVASLDSSGFVPSSQLPPIAKITVNAVANEAARLALTAESGDIAIQADNATTYVLSASPASTNANWKDISGISTAAADATSKVAAEAALRVSGDAASVSTAAADATSKVAAEATLRVSGDAASVSTAAADATSKSNAAKLGAENTSKAYTDEIAIDLLDNVQNSLMNYIHTNKLGSSLGVATLDLNGILNLAQVPSSIATATTVATAKSEAVSEAGTAADVKVSTAVSALTKSSVGLANVDNTSDALKPVSTAQATAIATAKSEAIADATSQVNALLTGAPAALNTLDELAAALGDDANFAGTVTTSLGLKAPLASPTFTGTVAGITKSMVGLSNIDNTSDLNKPISSLTQTALDTKINKLVETNPQPSSYSIIVSDAFKLIEMSGGGTLTIVDSVSFPTGTTIEVLQTTDSQVTIAGSGFVPNSTPGLKLRARWSSATLLKRGTNSWVVMGDLSA